MSASSINSLPIPCPWQRVVTANGVLLPPQTRGKRAERVERGVGRGRGIDRAERRRQRLALFPAFLNAMEAACTSAAVMGSFTNSSHNAAGMVIAATAGSTPTDFALRDISTPQRCHAMPRTHNS